MAAVDIPSGFSPRLPLLPELADMLRTRSFAAILLISLLPALVVSSFAPTASPLPLAARNIHSETEKAPVSTGRPTWVKASVIVGAGAMALATAATGYFFWKKLKQRREESLEAESRPNPEDHNPVSLDSRRDTQATDSHVRAVPIKKIPVITISRPSVQIPGEGVEISNEGIDISGNSHGLATVQEKGDYQDYQGVKGTHGGSPKLPVAVASAVRLTINTSGIPVDVGESGDTWTSAVLMTPKERTVANRDGTRSPVTPVAIARRVVSLDAKAMTCHFVFRNPIVSNAICVFSFQKDVPKTSPKTRVQVENIEIKDEGTEKDKR